MPSRAPRPRPRAAREALGPSRFQPALVVSGRNQINKWGTAKNTHLSPMILYRFHFLYDLIFYILALQSLETEAWIPNIWWCWKWYVYVWCYNWFILVRIDYMHVIFFKAQELYACMKTSLFHPPKIGLFWESTGPSQSTKLDGSNEVPNEQRSLVHFNSHVHGICLFFKAIYNDQPAEDTPKGIV